MQNPTVVSTSSSTDAISKALDRSSDLRTSSVPAYIARRGGVFVRGFPKDESDNPSVWVRKLKCINCSELKLCVPHTRCDVVVNHCAVCLSLLRRVFDPFSSFFTVLAFLRQRVSKCSFGVRCIPQWMW